MNAVFFLWKSTILKINIDLWLLFNGRSSKDHESCIMFTFIEYAFMDMYCGSKFTGGKHYNMTMVASTTTPIEFSLFFGAHCSVCEPHTHRHCLICKDLVGMQSLRPCSDHWIEICILMEVLSGSMKREGQCLLFSWCEQERKLS